MPNKKSQSTLNRAIDMVNKGENQCPICLSLPHNKDIGKLEQLVSEFGFRCTVNKTHEISAMEML